MRKNKSAIKRAIQSEKRRLRNSHVKSSMKSTIKKALVALKDKGQDKEQLQNVFRTAVRSIDRAASKGVIHRNNAARRVARLSKKIHEALS